MLYGCWMKSMVMLLGKKVGMTQVYDQGGSLFPVTVIQAGPCVVTQVKGVETDGYSAVQLSFDDVKASSRRRRKPQEGHAKKAGTEQKRFVREMRLPEGAEAEYTAGDTVTVTAFEKGQFVDVSGWSKGKGFTGVMKRHGFHGFPSSHGTERKHRAPGSLASFASDAGTGGNLKKGKKMAGHAGDRRVTTLNHELLSVDEENNLLVVKGSIPGPAGAYCVVRTSKKGGG
jgi:large subunit ribosomal protein L3